VCVCVCVCACVCVVSCDQTTFSYIGWGKRSGATLITVYFRASPGAGNANWITLAGANK